MRLQLHKATGRKANSQLVKYLTAFYPRDDLKTPTRNLATMEPFTQPRDQYTVGCSNRRRMGIRICLAKVLRSCPMAIKPQGTKPFSPAFPQRTQ